MFQANPEEIDIGKSLGIEPIRQGTLLNLILSYTTQPKYAIMVERVWNDPQLIAKEKIFCVFVIGQVSGMVRIMRLMNYRLGTIDEKKMPLARIVKVFLDKRQSIIV